MSGEAPQERPLGLAFFGTITASVTHELSNVIAIINELGGLLDDLLSLANAGAPVDLDKLKSLHGRLANQVARGDRIVRRLNRFAHSADYPVVEFDVSLVLDDLVRLTRRFTELKKVELVSELPEPGTTVTTDPFAFQQAVFLCIGHLLAAGKEGARIIVSAGATPEAVTIEVAGSDIEVERLEDTDPVVASSVVKSLHGSLTASTTEDGQVLRLVLPQGKAQSSSE